MPRKGENIYKRKDGRWEGRYIRSYDSEHKAKYAYVYGNLSCSVSLFESIWDSGESKTF